MKQISPRLKLGMQTFFIAFFFQKKKSQEVPLVISVAQGLDSWRQLPA